MSYLGTPYLSIPAVAGGSLNWDLGLERSTSGTGTIGTGTNTTAITIGRTGITATFPGAVTITQTLTTSGIVSLAAGTAAAPSLTFTGDVDLGLYRSAADILGFTCAGVSVGTWSATALVVTQAVATSGSPVAVTITGGAHTTLAASTEAIDVDFSLARTVQFATGALTTQRAVVIRSPTYAFVAASTVTNATTFDITAAPTAGTNATFTNTRVVRLGGDVTIGATTSSMTYRVIDIPAHTVTVTGSTLVTSASMAAAIALGAITITDSSAVTVGTVTTLYIAGPPVAAGSVTFTETTALFVDSGNVRFDGNLGIGTSPSTVDMLAISETQQTSGSPSIIAVTAAAHTTLTASTEASAFDWNLAATVQFAAGALTNQRMIYTQTATYAFASASTITNATAFDINTAPIAGSNATFTNTRIMRLGGAVNIGATSSGMTYTGIDIPAHTITVTGTTQVTSATMAAGIRLGIITITDSSAVTIDNAATLVITGAPAQAGSVTLTNAFAILISAGQSSIPLGSASAPSICFATDKDTGLFSSGANATGLAAGGTERLRVDATSTAGQTALLVYDVDNATLERVTVGVADSGGAGFKLLRIPN